MDAVAQDQWHLSLPLPPGAYCYRYLADLDGPAAYVSPAEAEDPPPPMRRLDAVLLHAPCSVEVVRERTRAAEAEPKTSA
jgi:hypothetical protein